MKNLLIAVVLIAVLGGGYYMMSKKSSPIVNEEKTESAVEKKTENEPTGASGTASETGAVKEFSVEGGMFYFKPNEIRVKKGDTVKVTFTNKEGMHDFVVDEFNAKTNRIKVGESETISFIADRAGTFEYYCSVGQHRANGMVGKLIVE